MVLVNLGNSTGSGIVLDKNGYIVTNAHVVSGGTGSARLTFSDGRVETAQVVQTDNARDIALLKVAPNDKLVPIVLAGATDVKVGQIAIAIGAPFGLDQSITQGIVSALGRPVQSFGQCNIDMVQTDAPINPGNSGGALVDRQGRLIGMNTSVRAQGSGIGFAVPADMIRVTVDRMIKGESLDVAYLGVQAAEGATTVGASIANATAGGPAATAGMRDGDVVTAFNKQAVNSWPELRARLQAAKVGDAVQLTVKRLDGSTADLTVTLAKHPRC